MDTKEKAIEQMRADLFGKHLHVLQEQHESQSAGETDEKRFPLWERIIILMYFNSKNDNPEELIEYIENCNKWNKTFIDCFITARKTDDCLESIIIRAGKVLFSEECVNLAEKRLNNKTGMNQKE